MRYLLYIALFILWGTGWSVAQFRTNVNLSPEQKAAVEQLKKLRKSTKEQKKQAKADRKGLLRNASFLGKQVGADEHLGPYYDAKDHEATARNLREVSKTDLKDSTSRQALAGQAAGQAGGGEYAGTYGQARQQQGKGKKLKKKNRKDSTDVTPADSTATRQPMVENDSTHLAVGDSTTQEPPLPPSDSTRQASDSPTPGDSTALHQDPADSTQAKKGLVRKVTKKDLKDSSDRQEVRRQLTNSKHTPEEAREIQARAGQYATQYESLNRQLKDNEALQDSLTGVLKMTARRFVRQPAYAESLYSAYETQINAGNAQQEQMTEAARMDREAQQQMLLNRARQLGTSQFASQTQEVQAAQQKLNALKRKYSYVPNSNDLSTARKANSLEDEPLINRFRFGGTLQIHPGKPLGIDFNPYVAYRITKKWNVGLGGTYRSSFGSGEKFFSGDEQETYGGRLFTDYYFFKSFYTHAEYERIHSNQVNPDTDQLEGLWSDGLMLGVGKDFELFRQLEGSVMILYNFLHERPGPYDRPWVIRFGFSWTGNKRNLVPKKLGKQQ